MKYTEYIGRKGGKKQKINPLLTWEILAPGEENRHRGHERSTAGPRRRPGGAKRQRSQFQLKLLRVQRNWSWKNLQNLQKQKYSLVAIFFPQRHYYHPCFTSREIKCLSNLPLAGLEPRFLQPSGTEITKRFLLFVLPSGDLENID